MKNILVILFVSLFVVYGAKAQTAKELLGKWKLVKWTKKGVDKDIRTEFKTDSVYQVFEEKNKFISIVGNQERTSKWKLSKDNSVLSIRANLVITIDFKIDYFDSKKRVITSDQMGTMEYVKVD